MPLSFMYVSYLAIALPYDLPAVKDSSLFKSSSFASAFRYRFLINVRCRLVGLGYVDYRIPDAQVAVALSALM
jgi:hypothetical protein